MKSLLLTISLGLFTSTMCIGQDLSGIWKGKLKQGTSKFNFQLELQKIDSINYNCTTTIEVGGEYGVMDAECSLIKGKLYFKENNIITDKSSENQWCLKTAKLSYSTSETKSRLEGSWTGYCAPGTILLSKGKIPKEIVLQPSIVDTKYPKIDSVFSKWDNIYSPGCAVGIIKDGKLIYTKGYGTANLDYKIPLSANSKLGLPF